MKDFVIRNARLYVQERVKDGLDLVVRGGKIDSVVPAGTVTDLPEVDYSGKMVTPGLIDIHIHGIGGKDCIEDSHDAIAVMAATLPRYGVTGFLPTAMTFRKDAMSAMVRRCAEEKFEGATVLGAHLEGPFINEALKGAQEAQYILPPSVETFKELAGDYPDTIREMTMDPSAPSALELIRALHSKVTFSAGHTPATYAQAVAASQAGLHHVTHCFNAMKPMHHREPGLLGAALSEDAFTCEFICDLIHLHPAAIRMAYKLKGKDRMCLISDSMMAAGLSEGKYMLGGQDVFVTGDGAARLADGTLAGSTLTLDKAVRNLVQKVGLPLDDVLAMATSTPAREIGEGSRRGRLLPGYEADLAVWDSSLNIVATWVAGECIYTR